MKNRGVLCFTDINSFNITRIVYTHLVIAIDSCPS